MKRSPLETLFDRHHPDGPAALRRFWQLFADAKMAFPMETSIKEREFLPQASFRNGMPSFIYYYIPGTAFGSVKKSPTSSVDPAHVYSTDGVGLNMGCPIRLYRALGALFSLKEADREEPLSKLKSPENHFAAVEELLWLTLWRNQSGITRGGELVSTRNGNKAKDVDWFFITDGVPIYLEAKFRPTDWIRHIDRGYRRFKESQFSEIGSKFPTEKSVLGKHVAAITGFAEPLVDSIDNSFFALCEKKLLKTTGLDAILYRSLLGPVYVCGLDQTTVGQIANAIQFSEPGEYPCAYPIFFNRQFREKRIEAQKPLTPMQEQGRVIFVILPNNRPLPVFEPKFPYRCAISDRTAQGEPTFETIPPFLK